MQPAQRTPSKTGQEIDRHIAYLNATWDLRLPRLHGKEAQDAEESDEYARKCSARIRALCWCGQVDVDSVIADFEERAQTLKSEWIYKPQQEKGTLLSLPRTKSFMGRNSFLKSKAPLSEEHRRSLVKTLACLLDDDYRLLRESDVYSRSSSTSSKTLRADNSETCSDASDSFKSAQSAQGLASEITNDKMSPMLQQSVSGSVRRRSMSNQPSARSKRRRTNVQHTIPNFFDKRGVDQQASRESHNHTLQKPKNSPLVSSGEPVSFTSIESQEPPQLFSPRLSMSSSVDTSMLSEADNLGDVTQHTDSTQHAQDVLDDPDIKRSLTEAEQKLFSTRELVEQMDDLNPFKQTGDDFDTTLPPWAAWELYRYATKMGLPPKILYNGVRNTFASSAPSYNQFCEIVRSVCAKHGLDKFPPKSEFPDWLSSSQTYCDPQMRRSIYFSAKLDIQHPLRTSIWQLTLLPMKTDKSCRFHRRWGADRFLEIDIPYFTTQYLPQELKNLDEVEHLENVLIEHLGLKELHIGGRTWRPFYLEKHETKGKKSKDGHAQRQILHLFAIDGYDMNAHGNHTSGSLRQTPVSLHEFVQWHIPTAPNALSTNLKLFSRMQLGLSKTTPTIVLKPHEFIAVSDMKSINADGEEDPSGPVMNDGCARISKELANAVWGKFCGQKASDEVPSCFQARIGGCKGVWFVENSDAYPNVSGRNYWIEITPAQCKIQPTPSLRADADDSQLTFEVVKHSTPCQSAHLNIQFINVLYDRGVQRAVLERLLRDDLKDYLEELQSAMGDQDTRYLRSWMQTYQKTTKDDFRFSGDKPTSRENEVNMLLEHGFHAESCPRLVHMIQGLLKQNLERYTDKMRILVPQSTTVFCIADPYRILEPGQVQINFSRAFLNARAGVDEADLEGKRVLLARNPAALPSDIQVAEAVFHPRLRYLRDCIIFPTKGEIPLAHKLSGGDYDGDTVIVIWDSVLTAMFQNVQVPNLPVATKCGLESHNQRVIDIINPVSPTPKQTDDFLVSCLRFNNKPPKVGIVTVLHEQLIYSHPKAMSSEIGIKLAALNGYLVDATKQGWHLPESSLQALRGQVRSLGKMTEMAYKSDCPRPQRSTDGKCLNIIDYLKFDVANGMRDFVLSAYEKQWLKVERYGQWKLKKFEPDPDLEKPYHDACLNQGEIEREVLQNLVMDLRRLISRWKATFPGSENESFSEKQTTRTTNWDENFEELTKLFLAIKPWTRSQSLSLRGVVYKHDMLSKDSEWSQIRASCLYGQWHEGKAPWCLAGETLCRIKARALGPTYLMRRDYRAFMKFDCRRFRSHINVRDDDDDSDVEDRVLRDENEG